MRSAESKRKTKPARLPNNALILDSGANIHIINNPSFLSCIRSCIRQFINTTGLCKECKLTGQLCDALKPLPLPLNGYLYQPNNIGNIISLSSLLSDSHRITTDTAVENACYVQNKHDGTYVKYKLCPRTNLYTYVIKEGKENNVVLHSTVEEESNKFSQKDQTRAKAVREMQQVLVSPSNYDLANTFENNVVQATLFTRRDVRIANIIYGCDVAALKGKSTKRQSKMPNPDEVRDVLEHIVKNYSKVSLYIDVMHINGIMFLKSVFKHIGLVQCICIRQKNCEKFLHAILLMIRVYCARGVFEVVSIGVDKAFDAVKSKIKNAPYNVSLTTCDADRHVELAKRTIRFVKERIRTVRLAIPYKIFVRRMTI